MGYLDADKISRLYRSYPSIFDLQGQAGEPLMVSPDILKFIDWEYQEQDEGILLTSRFTADGKPAASIFFPKGDGKITCEMADGTIYATYDVISWGNVYSMMSKFPNLEMPEALSGGFPFIEILRTAQKKGCMAIHAGDFLFCDRQTILSQDDLGKFNAMIVMRQSGTQICIKDFDGKKMLTPDYIKSMAGNGLFILPIRNGKPGKFIDIRKLGPNDRVKAICDTFEKLQESRSCDNMVPVSGNSTQMLVIEVSRNDRGQFTHRECVDIAKYTPGKHQESYLAINHALSDIPFSDHEHQPKGPS